MSKEYLGSQARRKLLRAGGAGVLGVLSGALPGLRALHSPNR
jgi:hypothetical protein